MEAPREGVSENFGEDDDIMTPAQAISQVATTILKPTKIRELTELADEEIVACTVMLFKGKRYTIDAYKEFIDHFQEQRLSKDRKSRREGLELVKSMKEHETKQGIFSKFRR